MKYIQAINMSAFPVPTFNTSSAIDGFQVEYTRLSFQRIHLMRGFEF